MEPHDGLHTVNRDNNILLRSPTASLALYTTTPVRTFTAGKSRHMPAQAKGKGVHTDLSKASASAAPPSPVTEPRSSTKTARRKKKSKSEKKDEEVPSIHEGKHGKRSSASSEETAAHSLPRVPKRSKKSDAQPDSTDMQVALAALQSITSRKSSCEKNAPLASVSDSAVAGADVDPSLGGSSSDDFEFVNSAEDNPGLIGVPRIDLTAGVSPAPEIFKKGTSFSLEEQIAEMTRKLPDTDSNEGKAFERAYQQQVAKQRAVIPHISADIIKELFLNPDQAFPRLHELLLECDRRLWFHAVCNACPSDKISLSTISQIREKTTDELERYQLLMKHILSTFRPHDAHKQAEVAFMNLVWQRDLSEPFTAYCMRAKNFYLIADAFRDSEMVKPMLLRKILCVLPQETLKILFEAKDMYARSCEMRACSEKDFSWVDGIAAEATKVMRSVEACLVIQTELTGADTSSKSASKLSALANEAGVGAADLGRALALLSGANSSLAQLSSAPNGGMSKRAAKKARAIARGQASGGTLNFVKKLQSAQPAYSGDKGELLKSLKVKYDAVDESIWGKRLKLISDNTKLDRQEHAEFFKLDRVKIEPGNGKAPYNTYVCVKCWKCKHTANFCSDNINKSK